MIRRWFDDSRLEIDDLTDKKSPWWLASAGARIRRAALSEPAGRLTHADRPRGVLVLEAEARLVRTVPEPACPVPFMAWPGPVLPAWVGPLDLVVVLGSHDAPAWEVRGLAEAIRRGATVIAAAPDESALTAAGVGPLTTHLPTPPNDPVAAAIAVLALLDQPEFKPRVDVEFAASATDAVTVRCSPARPLGDNPDKDLAAGLADSFPLAWGGATLVGRASQQIAETLRRTSGRLTLTADAEKLEAVLPDTPRRDVFTDPFEQDVEIDPTLLLLGVDQVPEPMMEAARRLARLTDCVGVRVCHISSGMAELDTSDVERYVALLLQRHYAATYLGIGPGPAQG